jgi:hypothetical protein
LVMFWHLFLSRNKILVCWKWWDLELNNWTTILNSSDVDLLAVLEIRCSIPWWEENKWGYR